MILTAILATDSAGAIGYQSGLPWPKMSRDLRRFRDATMGKVCIVGRTTCQGLPTLPGRRLVALSRGLVRRDAKPIAFCPTIGAALAFAKDEPEVMVIGGADIYRQLLPRCDRLLLTVVHGEWPADTWLERPTEGFVEIATETHDPDASNPARATFSEWVRR